MRAALLVTAFATAVAAAVVPVAPAAGEPTPPAAQLSITLTSNEKTVTSGDEITYTGRVENLGDSGAHLRIVLDAPDYVALADAEGAAVHGHQATWTTRVGSGATARFRIAASIHKIPRSERRVTTLASAYVGDAATPVVRTAVASFIAGVEDTPGGTARVTPAPAKPPASPLPWAIGGGVVLLVLIVLAAVLVARRRRTTVAP
jgi:hypothetical protein